MIYFIQNTQNKKIKIGYSKNPSNRLKSLQTGSPDKLKIIGKIDGNISFENKLHNKFHYLRRNGEWFVNGKELVDYINEQKKLKNRKQNINDPGVLDPKETMVGWEDGVDGGTVELFKWPDTLRLSAKCTYTGLACCSTFQRIKTKEEMQIALSDFTFILILEYKISQIVIHDQMSKIIGYAGCYAEQFFNKVIP